MGEAFALLRRWLDAVVAAVWWVFRALLGVVARIFRFVMWIFRVSPSP